MKKNVFIISDNDEIDRFWLEHKVKIFIESKIINENYGNFYFLSDNHPFDTYCIDYLKCLELKLKTILVSKNKELLDRIGLDRWFNKLELVENYNKYIEKNADYIIFYCKDENEFVKLAQKNNIDNINFY